MKTEQQFGQQIFNQATNDKVQEQFHRLKDVIYLNTALSSVMPDCVEQAYIYEQRQFLDSFASEIDWEEQRQQAREGIANLIGAKPANIALLSNTVEGIGIIARDYPWDKNKNIVTFSGEHPSNLLPMILGSRKGMFQLKAIGSGNESLTTSMVLEAIDEETQALALSAVQFTDGARIDLSIIGRECKKRGILFLIDGIQALGRLKIDVMETGIDYMSSGCHKGLLVRNGIGFAYCSDKILERLSLSTGAIQSITGSLKKCAYDPSEPIPWYDDARRLENGNRNHPGICGLIASLKFLSEIGIEKIENQIMFLQNELFNQLGQYTCKIRPKGELRSGIIRVDFPESKVDDVTILLEKNKIFATIRPNNIRFCISFFNTMDQIHKLACVIKEILAMGEE